MFFFCQKITIKRKGRQIYCRQIKNKKEFLDKIQNYGTELGDISMLQKIQEVMNSGDTCLSYHNHCSLNYFSKYQSKLNRPPTDDWALKRELHKIARQKVISYIETEILENQRILSLAYLKNCFSQFVTEMYEIAELDLNIFSTHALKDYIQSELKNKISFINIANETFVMSSQIDIETVCDEEIENILFEQEAQDFIYLFLFIYLFIYQSKYKYNRSTCCHWLLDVQEYV